MDFLLKIAFILILPLAFFARSAEAATMNVPTNFLRLNQGLVGWWTFDGPDVTDHVYDRSGQGNNGDLVGTASKTLGKIGQALDFSGTGLLGSYVQIPTLPTITSPFTTSFWFYPRDNVSTQGLISHTLFGSNGIFLAGGAIQISQGSNFRVYCHLGISSGDLNAWHHLVVIINSTTDPSLWKCYLDGVDGGVDVIDNSGYADPGNTDWTIGAYYNNSWWFDGKMDDVRVYNRALSTNEVTALDNSGGAKTSISKAKTGGSLDVGLTAFWTFDGADISGTSATDASGNSHTGTLANAPAKVIGKTGQALQFNGTSGQKMTTSFNPGGYPLSACAWVYNTATGVMNTIFNAPNLVLYHVGADADYYQIYNNNGNKDTANGTAKINQWQNVCVTVDASNNAIIYIDGVSAVSGSIGAQGATGNVSMGDSFNGLIDNARMYNRVLTPAEVKQIYNLGGSKMNASTNVTKGSLDAGLIGLWSFDGPDITDKIYDRSGQGNHASFIGGATSSAKTLGKIGQALRFDGVDDYVTIPGSANLKPTRFAVSVWVKDLGVIPTPAARWIFTVNQNDLKLYMADSGDGHIEAAIYDGVTPYNTLTGPVLNRGEWNQLTWTYDGTTQRLFWNGVEFTNGAAAIAYEATSAASIGSVSSGLLNWNGLIDNVRLYDRALSASEVKQLYNLGR